MKEKLTYFVVATAFLLILILIKTNVFIPNEVGKHITRGKDIILTCESNFLFDAYNSSVLILSNVNEICRGNRNQHQNQNQSHVYNSVDDNSFTIPLYQILEYVKIIFVNILNTAITCYEYSADYFHKNSIYHSAIRRWYVIRLFSKSLYINKLLKESICQLKTHRVLILKRFLLSEVLNFMIAITFVRLIIVAIAYQQLLHNGYIIIQNLYHKHTRQSETLVCNRPYQMKSGHGLDDEENCIQQQLVCASVSQKITHPISINSAQMLSKYNHLTIGQQENTLSDKQISKNSVQYSALTRSIVDHKNNQLYHQQQHSTTHYCHQQRSVLVNRYNVSYRTNHQFSYHRCFCQKNNFTFQLEQAQSTIPERYVKPRMMHNTSSSRQQTKVSISSSVSACQSSNFSVTSVETVASSKVRHYNRPQLTNVNRKSRKKKDVTDPKDMCDMSDIWQRSSAYSWCCDGFCNIFYSYHEYIHICNKSCGCSVFASQVCRSYCLCDPSVNVSGSVSEQIFVEPANLQEQYNNERSLSTKSYCSNSKNGQAKGSNIRSTNHQLSIVDISAKNTRSSSNSKNSYSSSKSSCGRYNNSCNSISSCVSSGNKTSCSSTKSSHAKRQRAGRKFSLDRDADSVSGDNDTENGNNLLRSLNAVKAITSVVQNRNYKRKLKKNLVWLFIGLVWLEGPKLINCSISHNDNDVTSVSGNETTNKLGNSQNNNSESSSGNSNSGGGGDGARNNSRNSAGPGPRTDASESKANIKDDQFYKITTSHATSSAGGSSYDNFNKFSFMQNSFAIEHALQVDKQYQRQVFNHQEPQDRIQPRKMPILSQKDFHSSRQPNERLPTPAMFYNSEESNRAQSDLVRLESIKRQILTKLGLTEKPNVTHPLPKQFIWDTIYRADGIRSVSDFDFNDDHRTQEHVRLSATVLEPPPLLTHHYQPIVKIINDIEDIQANQPQGGTANHSVASNDVAIGWHLKNLTTHQITDQKRQILPKYHKQHRLQQQRLKPIARNKNTKSHSQSQKHTQGQDSSQSQGQTQGKGSYTEPDYFEGDDFFGSTQEIITFAEKGKIYKKHRLVEFSPPSNKISKQKLQIRNAEIHIRIEKITERSFNSGRVDQSTNRQKQKEPNLKIWIFQLIGNDFSSKGFDQVATFCTSLSVNHNVLGWQKLDITETVQYWHSKHQKEKLRLLIDCTGCGNRYILHLFDRKYHHSFQLSPTTIRQAPPKPNETENISKTISTTINSSKPRKTQAQRHHYHYWQYNHHRYRRKNRTLPAPPVFNSSETVDFHQHGTQSGNRDSINQLHPWPSSNHHNRMSRETNVKESSEGISYEVGAEYHLEDRLNPNRPFLVLHTEPSRSRRVRRRAVDCSGAVHGQCCKESFYVSFKALGWDDWIIAPRGYFANYCRGDCTGPYRTPDTFQTFHAHFIEEYRKMGLLNGMQPCCAPVKFSSMSLIYYGDDGIIKRDLPKMVVDECGCP